MQLELEYIFLIRDGRSVELCRCLEANKNNEMLRDILRETAFPIKFRNLRCWTTGLHALCIFLKEKTDPPIPQDLHQKSTFQIVELFLQLGFDIEANEKFSEKEGPHPHRLTPLVVAIRSNKPTLVEALIKLGADVHKADKERLTPLHYAETEEIIDLLIASGVDANRLTGPTSQRELPLLHYMIQKEDTDKIDLLLKRGLNVNCEFFDGWEISDKSLSSNHHRLGVICQMSHVKKRFSALSLAISMDNVYSVELILQQADLIVSFDELDLCIVKGYAEFANKIIDKFTEQKKELLSNDKIKGKWSLHCLATNVIIFPQPHNIDQQENFAKDIQIEPKKLISTFVDNGWDINSISDFPKDKWYRNTLLSLAVIEHNNDLVTFLLVLGADPNRCIYQGDIFYPHDHDWDHKLNEPNDKHLTSSVWNPTALHVAIVYRNFQAVSILIKYGADLGQLFGYTTCKQAFCNRLATFCPNWRSTCFEKLIVTEDKASRLQLPDDLEWLTDFSSKVTLEEKHLTLAIFGGNVFIISKILQLLPENLSLKTHTMSDDRVPSLQYLINTINFAEAQQVHNNNGSDTLFWQSLREILEGFIQRGHDVNRYKCPVSFFQVLPVTYVAIQNVVKHGSRKLLELLSKIGGINWNAKFKEYRQETCLSFAMRTVFLQSMGRRGCWWTKSLDENAPELDEEKCISQEYLDTLKDLLDKGGLMTDSQLKRCLRIHTCIISDLELVKKFRLAGCNFKGAIEMMDSLKRGQDDGLRTITPIKFNQLSKCMEYMEEASRNPPTLANLAGLAVRESLNPSFIFRADRIDSRSILKELLGWIHLQ